jgi:hypothetical protein
VGSNLPPVYDSNRLAGLRSFFESGAPGGITRRCAPRPFGVALAGDQRRCATLSNPLFCLSWVRICRRCTIRTVWRGLGLFLKNGAPGGIRTHDPRLRRPILYPAELQARLTGWRYYSPPTSRVQRHALRRADWAGHRRLCCRIRCGMQFEDRRPIAGCNRLSGSARKRLG